MHCRHEFSVDDCIKSMKPEDVVVPEEVNRLYYYDERFEVVFRHKYALSESEYKAVLTSKGGKRYEDVKCGRDI